MTRRTLGTTLFVLLAGIGLCVWTLAGGRDAAWLPFLTPRSARIVFRTLTIAVGLGAWFVSQSLISARGFQDGTIGDAVHDWTAPLNGWLARNHGSANALLERDLRRSRSLAIVLGNGALPTMEKETASAARKTSIRFPEFLFRKPHELC